MLIVNAHFLLGDKQLYMLVVFYVFYVPLQPTLGCDTRKMYAKPKNYRFRPCYAKNVFQWDDSKFWISIMFSLPLD